MTKNATSLWSDLVASLDRLPPQASRADYFRNVASWVWAHADDLGPEVIRRYGIDRLATVNVDEYPIEESDVDTKEEIESLSRQTPSKLDIIAMFLRDQLWGLVAFKTSITCANCGEDNYRTLIDPLDGGLVLACDFCGWAVNPDGTKWFGESDCRPATSEELKRLGVI